MTFHAVFHFRYPDDRDQEFINRLLKDFLTFVVLPVTDGTKPVGDWAPV